MLRYWYYVYMMSDGAVGHSRRLIGTSFKCVSKLIGEKRIRYDLNASLAEIKFMLHNMGLFFNVCDVYTKNIEGNIDSDLKKLSSMKEFNSYIQDKMPKTLSKFTKILVILTSRPDFTKSVAKSWISKGLLNNISRISEYMLEFIKAEEKYSETILSILEQIQTVEESQTDDVHNSPAITTTTTTNTINTTNDSTCNQETTEVSALTKSEENKNKLSEARDRMLDKFRHQCITMGHNISLVLKRSSRLVSSLKYPKSVAHFAPLLLTEKFFSSYNLEQKIDVMRLLSIVSKADQKNVIESIPENLNMSLEDFCAHITSILVAADDLNFVQKGVHMLDRLTKGVKTSPRYCECSQKLLEAIKAKGLASKKLQNYMSLFTSRFKSGN